MTKDRVEIYLDERKLLVEAQQVSYQQFDKYILSLSTGFLSLSVTFLKDIFPRLEILCRNVLVVSWTLFSASILTTLLSFLLSQKAYKRQLLITEDYYVRQDEKALKAKNHWSTGTTILNSCSAIFFVLAVAATVYFVSVNFMRH
jgi:hypothetical protein